LYFTASTNRGLTGAGLDMSSDERRITRNVYVTELSKDEKSPLAPESDEEKAKDEKKAEQDKDKDKSKDQDKPKSKTKPSGASGSEDAKDDPERKKDEPVVVKIDIENIGQRILSLPIPAKNYLNMVGGKTGILFLAEGPMIITDDDQPNVSQTIQKFDLSKRKVDKLIEDVNDFTVSFDGEKILYRKGDAWATSAADDSPGGGPPKPGFGPLKLDNWEVYVEPRAMWKEIYNETWRIERDFFYDPNHHGLDIEKARKKYEPYLDGIASRDELTYLFQECLGELTVGHMFVGE